MPNQSNDISQKKSIYVVIAIFLLILVIVGALVNFLINRKEKNSLVNDTSLENIEESSTKTTPTYEQVDSDQAFREMKVLASAWSSDVQYVDCSGNIYPYDMSDGIQNYIGGDDGMYPSWGCTIYSKSKKQDVRVVWRTGEAKLEADDPYIWGQSKYEQNPNDRELFRLNDFKKGSAVIYENLLSTGFNPDTEYASIAFGFYDVIKKFGDKPVWEVQVYSRTELENSEDEYSQGRLLRTLFFDAKSGIQL